MRGIPDSVLHWLRELGSNGGRVLLRRGMTTTPGLFERALAAFCRAQDIEYEWVMPEPNGRRESTYLRDIEMARRADLVMTFFADDHMAGGTAHLTEAGISAGTPTYAWGLSPDGARFVRVGEYDPDHVWAERLPTI